HFSKDLLSSLLNEPIPGHGVFWSSASAAAGTSGRSYPVPFRALSFELLHKRQDESYALPAVPTYASGLRAEFDERVRDAAKLPEVEVTSESVGDVSAISPDNDRGGADPLALFKARAISALAVSQEFRRAIEAKGFPWGAVVG